MRRALAVAAVSAAALAASPRARADDARPRARTAEAPTRADTLIAVRASLGAGARHFAYSVRITPTLRPYDLPAAPLATLDGEVYPLARTRLAVLRDLGVVGAFTRAVALSSVDDGGDHVSTTWQSFEVGARQRIRAGRAALFGVRAGYGGDDFGFGGAQTAGAVLPSVAYRYARAGGDARLSFGTFAVYGEGAYLAVLSSGAMDALFPRAWFGGVDARVGIAYRFARHLELSAELGYTRFFSSFHPEPGDAHVAGGALDQRELASLGLTYLL